MIDIVRLMFRPIEIYDWLVIAVLPMRSENPGSCYDSLLMQMTVVIRGPCELWFDTTCFEDIQFQESAPSLGAEHRVDHSLSFQSRNYPYTVAHRGCYPYHSGNDRKPVLRCSPLLGARMDDCGNPDCVHIVARFIDAHIISILLDCYTLWHDEGVWG